MRQDKTIITQFTASSEKEKWAAKLKRMTKKRKTADGVSIDKTMN
jgi:hypothetical protein